jgi:hypothetical protein
MQSGCYHCCTHHGMQSSNSGDKQLAQHLSGLHRGQLTTALTEPELNHTRQGAASQPHVQHNIRKGTCCT